MRGINRPEAPAAQDPPITDRGPLREIALFVLVVYTITWVLCLVFRGPAGRGELWPLFAWLLPTVWSPTIFAIVLAAMRGGRTALWRELQRLRAGAGSVRWLLLAIALPAATVAVAVTVARAAGDATPVISAFNIVPMIAIQLMTGAVGEELGWRGFLLPRLRVIAGTVGGWWTMAVLWSLWHIAGMFFPGTPLQVAPAGLFLLGVTFFGVFLAFLFERTGSVLVTIAAHLSLNVALGIGGAHPSSAPFWWTIAAIFGVIALGASLVSGSHKR